jgi:hypothetical protein
MQQWRQLILREKKKDHGMKALKDSHREEEISCNKSAKIFSYRRRNITQQEC